MSITHLLNKVMTIWSISTGQDASGGVVESWKIDLSGVPCRIRQLLMDERAGLGREMVPSTHRIYADAGITVTTTHKLMIEGVDYNVVRVNDPHGLGRHLEIDVRLWQ